MADNVQETLDHLEVIELNSVQPLADVLSRGIDLAIENILIQGYQYPNTYVQAVTKQLADVWTQAAVTAEKVLPGLVQKAVPLNSVLHPILAQYSDNHGALNASRILTTTQNIVLDKVRRGLARGQSQEELVRQILNESPQISLIRAQIIVANEAHSVSQYTSQYLAANSGQLLRKVWNSINDERTRNFDFGSRVSQFNHRVMNGQTRPISDSFSIPTRLGGFELLLHPGDPNGSAGNIINCRCIQTYEEAL